MAKTQASAERLVEAAAINKSLTALGVVIASFARRDIYIHYRDVNMTYTVADPSICDYKARNFLNISLLECYLL